MTTHPFLAKLGGAAAGLAVATIWMPVHAATNLNSSKSNVYKAILTEADEAACLKNAGTVVMRDGKKFCLIPATAPSPN